MHGKVIRTMHQLRSGQFMTTHGCRQTHVARRSQFKISIRGWFTFQQTFQLFMVLFKLIASFFHWVAPQKVGRTKVYWPLVFDVAKGQTGKKIFAPCDLLCFSNFKTCWGIVDFLWWVGRFCGEAATALSPCNPKNWVDVRRRCARPLRAGLPASSTLVWPVEMKFPSNEISAETLSMDKWRDLRGSWLAWDLGDMDDSSRGSG